MSRVQSIERAFAVLGALADGPLGVTEVAERADLPKCTAARLLASLAARGRGRAGPGRHAATGSGRGSRRSPPASAGPRPRRASPGPTSSSSRPRLGEAAGLSIPDGGPRPLRRPGRHARTRSAVRDWTGTRVPMHAVSSGQVFLAQPRPVDLERYLAGRSSAFTADAADRDALPRAARAGSGATASPGSATSSPMGSRSVAAAVADARARSSPRSTSTGRRTDSRAAGEETREVVLAAARAASRLREDTGGSRLRAGA